MLRPVFVGLIEFLLVVVRKPSLKLPNIVVVVSARSGNYAERRIRRDLVARHGVFHFAGILVDIVAIVLVICPLPFFVVLIEFPLIVCREPALPLSCITILIAVGIRILRLGH